MGYLYNLTQELAAKLGDLGDDRRTEVMQFVKEKVWESYRNGLEAAGTTKVGTELMQNSRQGRPARKPVKSS